MNIFSLILHKRIFRLEGHILNIEQKSNNYDILDLVKFILSLMVVAIHTKLFPKYLYPWLRIAVPMFFIISSYLLNMKIINSPKEEKWIIIRKYIKRLVLYYLFWFIVLIPFTVDRRTEWFNYGIKNGIILFIRCLLFTSTFVASWYISATIIGTLIVYKLSEKINDIALCIIYMIIFGICCIISSYSYLYQNIEIIKKIINSFTQFIASPIFSFPVALIYIHIGKLFAENKMKIFKYKNKVYLFFSVLFAILLYIEWRYSIKQNKVFNKDCYFVLLPFCFSLFSLIKGITIKLKNPKLLRKVSNITYPLHGSIAFFIQDNMPEWIKKQSLKGIFNFIVTLFIVYLICFIIIKLERKKCFKFLKYSH